MTASQADGTGSNGGISNKASQNSDSVLAKETNHADGGNSAFSSSNRSDGELKDEAIPVGVNKQSSGGLDVNNNQDDTDNEIDNWGENASFQENSGKNSKSGVSAGGNSASNKNGADQKDDD